MQQDQADELNGKGSAIEQSVDAQSAAPEATSAKAVASEEDIVQQYKNAAGNKRRQDKSILMKLKNKVKELKKDDSNVYPLY